ncbi:hypothetical protein CFBP5875_04695 [Agrobacterium pusense]|uniref:SGNH/GDSL hydrolase family protein n=1 Tax=Agrobacterium pusense TaxID=648995 RepID=UPI0010BF45D6|nr:SGNH/GDSL hydrolase family protein [Agrobacterium pusense]QCL83917.1 hypothetical protein CFBP5875_04695 [Agrobacterium pusense]
MSKRSVALRKQGRPGWTSPGKAAIIRKMLRTSVGVPGAINLKSGNTTKLRAGIAAMKAGSRNANIGFVHDSTTREGMTGVGGSFDNRLGYPMYLAQQLTSSGLSSRADNIFGTNGQSSLDTFISQFEPRVSYTGTATADATLDGFGGRMFRTASGAITFDFTAAPAFDRIEFIHAFFGGGAATVNISINGGATIQTVNTNGTPSQTRKTVINCPLGSHTVTVQSNGTCLFSGINVFNSAAKSVELYNFAAHGATLPTPSGAPPIMPSPTTGAYSPYGSRKSVGVLALDAVFLMSGINECRQGIPVDSTPDGFKQRLQLDHDTFAAAGIDVIFMTPLFDGDPAGSNLEQYAQVVRDLAQANDKPCLDIRALMGSYAQEQANGYLGDNVHLIGSTGNAALAAMVAKVVKWAEANP